MIINVPFLNVRGKNSPSLLYWDIIQFAMPLVIQAEFCMEEIYQRTQKYSQLTIVFDPLEL